MKIKYITQLKRREFTYLRFRENEEVEGRPFIRVEQCDAWCGSYRDITHLHDRLAGSFPKNQFKLELIYD